MWKVKCTDHITNYTKARNAAVKVYSLQTHDGVINHYASFVSEGLCWWTQENGLNNPLS